MKKRLSCLRFVFMALALLFSAIPFPSFIAQAQNAPDLSSLTPEPVALAIGGNLIQGKSGFLGNVLLLTEDEFDELRDSNSGSVAYKYGLGDSMLAGPRLYSTYDNHGTPVWHYKKVYGIDIRKMAQALGIDTTQVLTVAATSSDKMAYSLEDAFNVNTTRYYYNPQGVATAEVMPILAIYEATSTTSDFPTAGSAVILPTTPVTGAGSPDAVLPVFGHGQEEIDSHNGCRWVKYVNKLRIGIESPALSLKDLAGRVVTSSLSNIVLMGKYQTAYTYDIATHNVTGLPLLALLDNLEIDVPSGSALKLTSDSGAEREIGFDDLKNCFAAWQATKDGSLVSNSTALRLYLPGAKAGEGIFADLAAVEVVKPTGENPPETEVFTDLAHHSWAADSVNYLYEQGVVQGDGGGRFMPGDQLKRCDFLLMLHRAYHFDSAVREDFEDVAADAYYYEAVTAARGLDIAQGDGVRFHPLQPITRQDAMALIYRTLQWLGSAPAAQGDLSSFSDRDQVADYALEGVSALVGAGVISGSDGRLDPRGLMTRAEMAKALHYTLIMP